MEMTEFLKKTAIILFVLLKIDKKSLIRAPLYIEVHTETSHCGLVYSQDPRLSRGLEEALEGHTTDNAPQGASNGSANCIADSWQAP